jgi:hypothetical protein
LRPEWLASKAREAEMRNKQVKTPPGLPFQKQADVPPVMATSYSSVAQKYLLDSSRNPDLPIEAPPQPPPPPKMPALPQYHGMFDIGGGPTIVLSAGGGNKRLHAGEEIGEFKLIAFNSEQIELEWNNERIIKPLAELAGHSAPQQQGGGQAADNTPAPPPQPVQQRPLGPGACGADGRCACQVNDSMPVGTVVNGVRKTSVHNPLLNSDNCIWVPAGQ